MINVGDKRRRCYSIEEQNQIIRHSITRLIFGCDTLSEEGQCESADSSRGSRAARHGLGCSNRQLVIQGVLTDMLHMAQPYVNSSCCKCRQI
jgi:hypothetical protein